MPTPAPDMNFDGLVGPTHNYAGMAWGNVASQEHRGLTSNPRAAVLQGLDKMATLIDLGLHQGVLPPLARPNVPLLRQLGFSGTSDEHILEKAWKDDPDLVIALSNASPMWTANAATVSPAAHCPDGRVHFTAANLADKFHRATEAHDTSALLRTAFPDPRFFAHHGPLPTHPALGDEGAANHMLLRTPDGRPGLEVFVHGRNGVGQETVLPQRYPARQARTASQAVARHHGLSPAHALFLQQHPHTIDQGVFHNDVIAVANDTVLLYHEAAFLDEDLLLDRARAALGAAFRPLRVHNDELTVEEAVHTYLFNAQLVTLPDGSMALIAPAECAESPRVQAVLQRLLAAGSPLQHIRTLDLRESMRNGGGPACLRLRVPLTADARAAVHPGFTLDSQRIDSLRSWAIRHYRDHLVPTDLGDPQLLREVQTALDELTAILETGPIYPFQRG